ncbi:MAG: hypothetical protein IJS74_03585 [Clostridia bacterium]|nr:hypothetical protein [Clostridia bacterium]
MGFMNFINLISSDAEGVVDPLYKAIDTIGPYAISIVTLLGVLYGIIIGVKFAKAEEKEERAKLQKVLVNGVIGAVTVLILLVVLYAIREPLVRWMNS